MFTTALFAQELPDKPAAQPTISSEPNTSARWTYSRRNLEKHREQEHVDTVTLPYVTQFQERSASAVPGTSSENVPATNSRLGFVVWVDSTHKTVVGYLDSKFLEIESPIVTRNEDLEITATLSPTLIRRGRAFGFDILSGFPNEGDAIIFPADTS